MEGKFQGSQKTNHETDTFIIQELHNVGYAHHDIAMRNIMYNEETKQVKIIDFGLAPKLTQEMMEKVEKKLFTLIDFLHEELHSHS